VLTGKILQINKIGFYIIETVE